MNAAKNALTSASMLDSKYMVLKPGTFVNVQINEPSDAFWLPNTVGLLLATQVSITDVEYLIAYKTKTGLERGGNWIFISNHAVVHPKFERIEKEEERLSKDALFFAPAGYTFNEETGDCSGLRNANLNATIKRAMQYQSERIAELKPAVMYKGNKKFR